MRPLFWWRRCWTAGADADVTEVEAAIERVAAVSTDPGQVYGEGVKARFFRPTAQQRGRGQGHEFTLVTSW